MSVSPSLAQDLAGQCAAPPSRALLYLLYHELSADPGAYRYALSTTLFRDHLALLRHLRGAHQQGICPEITFDDGHLSNFDQALPLLGDAGMKAYFFITAGWTDHRPAYMTWAQLRELAGAGHPIGAHGWSHKLLTHCSDMELETELGRARSTLEDKLGLAITTLSLPGGRFDKRILAACQRFGYTHVFTSVPRVTTDPAQGVVGRLNLRSDVTTEWLASLLDSPAGPIRRLERQYRLKAAAQRVMGDALYARLWTALNRAQTVAEPS